MSSSIQIRKMAGNDVDLIYGGLVGHDVSKPRGMEYEMCSGFLSVLLEFDKQIRANLNLFMRGECPRPCWGSVS